MSSCPPSTTSVVPLIKRASSAARKQIAAAMSSDLPIAPIIFSAPDLTLGLFRSIGVSTAPGATELVRILRSSNSSPQLDDFGNRADESVSAQHRRFQNRTLSASQETTASVAETVQSEQEDRKRFSFNGILAAAKELGISNFQLADMTGLSVVSIAQFDRGLIKLNENLPRQIVKRIAAATSVTTGEKSERL